MEHGHTEISNNSYTFTQREKLIAIVLMVIGAVSIAASFMTGSHQAWTNLLLNNFFFMAIALGATFFVAVQYAAEAGWSVGIRRVPEAMGQFLLFSGIIMIVIFLAGGHHLYHWTHHDLYDPASEHYDSIIDGKSGYLNTPFFVIRMVLYFVIWVWFTKVLRKHSMLEDIEGGLEHYKKNHRYGITFLVLFAITSSTSAWDFIMSIDTHWFSTLFGWYTFAGIFISALSMMALFIVYLKSRGLMTHVNEHVMHDVGKFMFAFSIFWTYLWFSQFMLIWYSNIPEEITYFQTRFEHYRVPFLALFFINFIFPFLMFMSRDAKRKAGLMTVVGVVLIFGHWLDVFIMVTPGVVGHHWHFGWMEIGTMLGFLGAFLYVTKIHLAKASLMPKQDPFMQESLHHSI
ncbi:MAG TPA: quinol:cytochrome C oxidoreductase [Bacteroidia bacterium]|nr:quinol:cytochrome C oxidoreductase [Bacteroidia bacterium]HNT79313.1 quinol:cytochrome C oxidoreductase [Bacteroidia bacterium]